MKIFERFERLFEREPSYNEVSIIRKRKYEDELDRRIKLQNAWDNRREQRRRKMKDAANLYVNTKSTSNFDPLRAIAEYQSGTFYNTSGFGGLGKLTIGSGFYKSHNPTERIIG